MNLIQAYPQWIVVQRDASKLAIASADYECFTSRAAVIACYLTREEAISTVDDNTAPSPPAKPTRVRSKPIPLIPQPEPAPVPSRKRNPTRFSDADYDRVDLIF